MTYDSASTKLNFESHSFTHILRGLYLQLLSYSDLLNGIERLRYEDSFEFPRDRRGKETDKSIEREVGGEFDRMESGRFGRSVREF
jgi:hypothetical protein